MDWNGRPVLITGGASFIGSHLVDRLVERGAKVRVVDDFSSGQASHLAQHVEQESIEVVNGDLRNSTVVRRATDGMSVVFHLAADHGGRGYVDLYQAGPASNLMLDGLVFWNAVQSKVEKVVFASSGCVYPNFMQANVNEELYLTEDQVAAPYDADNMYGWAKLMGELTLQAYHKEHGLGAASCRYFTVYGPRAKENHAVLAMIARAFVGQDPFDVWGDGTQVRNWTHVDDIVAGTILAAENIDDGTAINLGTMERITVVDAAKSVLEMSGHNAKINFLPGMPTGPLNRVADNSLAKKLLDWEPEIKFKDGLKRTLDWYFATKSKAEVERVLEAGGLFARKVTI